MRIFKKNLNNLFQQSMGVMDMVTPDVNVYERTEQDRFLVCTDGVIEHPGDDSEYVGNFW